MYQPYPGHDTQLPDVPRGPAPASVLTAVKAMYAGAAASVIGIVIQLVTIGATKTAIEKHSPNLSASQVNASQHTLIAGFAVGGVIAAVVWIVLARACQRGRNWARITGTVLFALATLNAFVGLATPIAVLPRIWALVVWLAGLTAVVFLWRRDSGAYFQQQPPGMIEVERLSKRFGAVTAVDDLSFTVRPGRVTGFLGPNGAGKTTTMRVILGLNAPTSGRALVGGRRYDGLIRPLREVGSLLDATALHAGRTALAHLRSVAQSNGITPQRVTEVLGLTGLEAVAQRRVGGYSLGMKQRLGIAAAMLGDPPVLMFDEPVNGLDPEGIHWIRGFLKELAGQGRTVLVSSHLMSEMALTADHLVIIGRGRLLADESTEALIESSARQDVLVRSPRAGELAGLITSRDGTVTREGDGTSEGDGALAVTGLDAAAIGELAAAHGIPLHALVPRQASLEEAYLELTGESTEYRGERKTP